ncbi:S8 family serine peptidase [Fodinicola acaciae]|uniref:S8 family serine peptidase n=1 Tax=Fodinicola acaciae TaxID=2681555 RepID=UPI0013D48B10|nr:S8 family serine peptidase [Fodinicola acaciae]
MRESTRQGWAALGAALIGLIAVGLTVIVASIGWLAEQIALASEVHLWAGISPLVAIVPPLMTGAVASIVGLVVTLPWLRATMRLWAVAAGCAVLLGLTRLVPYDRDIVLRNSLAFGATILIAGALAVLLLFVWRTAKKTPAQWLTAAAAGILALLPWALLGALGSPWMTLLAALAAAAVALLLTALPTDDLPDNAVLRGLVLGVAYAVVAVNAAPSGLGVLLMFSLPPLAFVAATLVNRWAAAVAVALAIFGTFAYVDASQLSLVLEFDDVSKYATIAAGISWLVAIAVAFLPLLLKKKWIAGAVAACCLAALVVAGVTVRPGFHANAIFVTLKQADLSAVATIQDPRQRRRAVYQKLTAYADGSQRAIRRALTGRGLDFRSYYLVNAVEVITDDPATRAWLAGFDGVTAITDAPVLRPLPETPAPMTGNATAPTGPLWNITAIGADKAWTAGARGQGIVVGESDSGVDVTHPVLAKGFRGGADSWYDPWYQTSTPHDPNGHGTHTTATAVGRNGIGVAPDAQWIACSNLARNTANPGYYLDCLQFMLAPFPRGGDAFHANPDRGADVLNNSWGCTEFEGCQPKTLEPAAHALETAGVFAVFGAGNSGPRCGSIVDPLANSPDVVSVGAVDRNRQMADFSSRGPVSGAAKPDVVAPGVGVTSALPGGMYGSLDGTSMATPHVTGVVALMWSVSPQLRGNVTQTAAILRTTADRQVHDNSTCGRNNAVGAGEVDAAAAVTAARAYQPARG